MQASFWAILGFLLISLEIFTGTFVLLFFGIGGVLTAFVKYLHLIDSLPIEILIFSFFSFLNLGLFRRKIKKNWAPAGHFSKEQTIVLEVSIAPQERKTVSYQGTSWQAINSSHETLNVGEEVTIDKIEGVTLHLKPKKGKSHD